MDKLPSSSSPSAPPLRPSMIAPTYGAAGDAAAGAGDRVTYPDRMVDGDGGPLAQQQEALHQSGHYRNVSGNYYNHHPHHHRDHDRDGNDDQDRGHDASYSEGTRPMSLDHFVSQLESSSGRRGGGRGDGGQGDRSGTSSEHARKGQGATTRGLGWISSAGNNNNTNNNDDDDPEKRCRICFETAATADSSLGRLISPCLCKGSSKYIHLGCLERWQQMSPKASSKFQCDTCHYQYAYSRPRMAAWLEKTWLVFLLALVFTILLYYLTALIGHALAQGPEPVWDWKPQSGLLASNHTVMGINWADVAFAVVACGVLTLVAWILAVLTRWIVKAVRRQRRIAQRRREQREETALEERQGYGQADTTAAAGGEGEGGGGGRSTLRTAAGAAVAGVGGLFAGLMCCSCGSTSMDDDIEAAVLRVNGNDYDDEEGEPLCSCYGAGDMCFPSAIGSGDATAGFMVMLVM
ncbi:hypothetical protein BGZ73_001351, partial [Actinomortierella ambigua]